jgi:hypothetical protein
VVLRHLVYGEGEQSASSYFSFTEVIRTPRKSNEYDAGWVTGPDWTFWRTDKSLARDGDRTPDRPKRSLVPIILIY